MYLIFDTETTGLPRDYNAPLSDSDNWPRVVQIAWQLHDNEGNTIEYKNFIVKPEGFTIPFNAEKVHGISTAKALAEGLPLAEVMSEFSKAVAQAKYLAGHNIEFDLNICGAEYFRLAQVHAGQSWWVMNFILHWTIWLEVLILGFAGVVYLRSRQGHVSPRRRRFY